MSDEKQDKTPFGEDKATYRAAIAGVFANVYITTFNILGESKQYNPAVSYDDICDAALHTAVSSVGGFMQAYNKYDMDVGLPEDVRRRIDMMFKNAKAELESELEN